MIDEKEEARARFQGEPGRLFAWAGLISGAIHGSFIQGSGLKQVAKGMAAGFKDGDKSRMSHGFAWQRMGMRICSFSRFMDSLYDGWFLVAKV
jgi:hypothetical protein